MHYFNHRNKCIAWMWLLLFPRLLGANSHRLGNDVYNINTDLQSLLQDTTLSQDKELTEALAWIDKLPTETSCTQLAAMKLMTECKLLDDPSGFAATHPEVHLDDIKLEYAVKLAVCEIAGAQPDQPQSTLQNCQVFLPSTQACNKRSWWSHTRQSTPNEMPCYPQSSDKDLHMCFKTLRSSPQYWTSYSNAKFRAANMCQLSRHAIEREKTIQLHKNLTMVTFRLRSSLHNVESQMRAMQNELRESTEGFKVSSEEIKQSTDHFSRFMQESQTEAAKQRQIAKNEMRSVQIEIGLVRDSIIAGITAHNEKFNSEMDAAMTRAVTAMQSGHVDTLTAISNELRQFYSTLQNEGSALAVSMNSQLQEHHEKAILAIQIQHGMMIESYNIMTAGLEDASLKINGLASKVDGLDKKTQRSLVKLDNLDHRLDGIGSKFKSVEQAFAVLDIVFGFGQLCVAVVLILAILFILPSVKKHLSTISLFVLASVMFAIWRYGSKFQAPFEIVLPDRGNSTALTKDAWTKHIFTPSPYLWGGVAISCFFLAAILHHLNAIWDTVADCLHRVSFKLACWTGILLQRRDKNSTLILPSTEIPTC
ncbi:unnamed protein product [Periconia digitata]|uniref:Protein brambleberry n=1 Tax=Periconia digitata TaxID=1303443 RepID=A0A9W4U8X7_9PLEO|nr:unnamed protein product [Periconia digitata]